VLLALSLVWLAIVIWLIIRAIRQRDVLRPLEMAQGAPTSDASVTVIVPARNESGNIAACLRSVLSQNISRDRLRVIVVDDASNDGTGAIVAAIAKADARLTLVQARELPRGWTGKCNACWLGAKQAPQNSDWLCFVDADMRLQPPLLASALEAANQNKLDLLSLTPRHDLKSFAERLMLPCGHYLLAFSQDLRRIQATESQDAVATGQFMLFRQPAYEAAGGHAAVCGAICEDIELARLIKRRGGRVQLLDGSALLATRMYTGWATLWPGIAKNLSEMLGGPQRTVASAIVAVTLSWAAVLLPAVSIARCSGGTSIECVAALLSSLASAAAFAFHIAGARYFQIPLFYGLLFPIGYSAGALIAFDSLRWRLTHRVRWKDRVYP
jgi:chlorobactene glucosyltransferase